MPTEPTEDPSPENQRPPAPGKLVPEQRLSIVKRIEAGEKQIALASEFGVTRQAISLLMAKYRKGGEEAILGARRGRKPSRKLSPEEQEAIHAIVSSKKTPKGAGLELAGKGKNKWDADSLKRLIQRECSFVPTKGLVADLLAKWDLAPQREREFSQDYYDYINSDVGKEVARRDWEMREKQSREKREAAGETQPSDGDGDHCDEDVVEEIEYTDEDLAKIRSQMLAARPIGGGVGERTGKHSKSRGAQTPSRKKRKKRRKK